MQFNESQHPRDSQGQWTAGDASTAIQKAASDKKNNPTDELKTYAERLTELQKKIHDLADKISLQNNGGITGDYVHLIDEWSKVKASALRITELEFSINTMQDQLINDVLPDHVIERLKDRLAREIESVEKELKSARRVEKKAMEVFNSLKTST